MTLSTDLITPLKGEALVLDPVEIAEERTQIDLTEYVAQAGPDWGDSVLEQYLADAQQGQLPVDYRVPSRVITIPLLLRGLTLTTFDEIRRALQAKVGLLQREGGWLKRATTIGPLYADITGATLKMGGSTNQALYELDTDAVLTLTCLPDFYGEERVGEIHTSAVDDGELVYTLDEPVAGDYPARTRIVVTELSGRLQRGLMWALRSRHYSPAPTNQPAYAAEDLTPVAPAVVSGSQIVYPSLPTQWTAVVGTNLNGADPLTHVGSYRVWMRAKCAHPASIRLLWDVGDLVYPATNTAVQLGSNYSVVDLGEIRLDRAPTGTHRWGGIIQAKAASAGAGSLTVNRLWFQSLDESSGRVIAPPFPTVGLTGYSVRDEFEQGPGGLTGKALPQSGVGVWRQAAVTNGDADDFQLDDPNNRVLRSTANDTGRRIAIAGPDLTNLVTQIDFYHPTPPTGPPLSGDQQVFSIFRYVDGQNYGWAQVTPGTLGLGVTVGDNPTTLIKANIPPYYDAWWTLRVMVLDTGALFAWLFRQNTSSETPVAARTDATVTDLFATGKPLASGATGIGDSYGGGTATTRYYDNFATWVPDIDAVLYPNRRAELRFDGMYRERASGNGYFAPVTEVIGDLPRLPASGLEGRDVELFLKPSEGDFAVTPDPSVSQINAQVYYRPAYLFCPE